MKSISKVIFALFIAISVAMAPVAASASLFKDGLVLYEAKKYKEAAVLFQKGADKGDVYSQTILAFMYAKGRGVKRSQKKAFGLNEKAAKRGHPVAMYNLAVAYMNGHGVKKDRKKSVFWLKKAAELGSKPAQKALRKLRRIK